MLLITFCFITWSSYQEISQLPQVKWTIPLSLGDSHKGYRVLATNKDYFNYYRYGHKQLLHLAKGQVFNDVFDVVLGSEVAKALNYNIGDKIILAHGVSLISLANHNDTPFKVVGILTQTGTPVDRTLHISLAGMEAIHIDWQNGTSPPTKEHTLEQDRVKQLKLKPQQITAFLLGLKSKIATFTVQRKINNYAQEPLLAILPGVALQELWSLISVAEKALLIVSLFVILTGLVGMLTSILTGLNERRREMAILRSVGATPWHILYLMLVEAFILGFVGIVMGLIILYSTIFACQTWVQAQYGLYLPLGLPSYYELRLLAGILIASATVGLIPAWHAYRRSLIDGLSIKI